MICAEKMSGLAYALSTNSSVIARKERKLHGLFAGDASLLLEVRVFARMLLIVLM